MYFKFVKIIFVLFLVSETTDLISQDTTVLLLPDTAFTINDPEYELLMSASNGDTLKLMALLENGVDVNTRNYDGVTPLMYAANNGHLRTVELLIDKGADVNLLPNNRVSALLGACYSEHVYIADTLIQNGANINTKNRFGITPLMVAAAFGNYTMADMLIYYGANIDSWDRDDNTALTMAVSYNNANIAELLVEKGSDINQGDEKHYTPLMIAAQNGYSELTNFLLDQGAIIDTVNDNNFTPLALSVLNKKIETCSILIERGANINHYVSKNKNLLNLAQEYKRKEIANLLKNKGAQRNYKPVFHKLGFGILTNFNGDDFMMGGSMILAESKYDLEFEVNFMTRPAVRSILYKTGTKTYFQFWEKRSVLQLGFNKNFSLKKNSIHYYGGLQAGLYGGYTYGNFRGSSKKPDDTFIFIPKIGLYYNLKNVYIKLNYEYMQLKNTNFSPHRIELLIGVSFNLSKYKTEIKPFPIL